VGLPFASLEAEGEIVPDGAWSLDGGIWGTISTTFSRRMNQKSLAEKLGRVRRGRKQEASSRCFLDALADAVEEALDMDRLRDIIGLNGMAHTTRIFMSKLKRPSRDRRDG